MKQYENDGQDTRILPVVLQNEKSNLRETPAGPNPAGVSFPSLCVSENAT